MSGSNYISDRDLRQVRRMIDEGRSIPAIIVKALLDRMEEAERRGLAEPSKRPRHVHSRASTDQPGVNADWNLTHQST